MANKCTCMYTVYIYIYVKQMTVDNVTTFYLNVINLSSFSILNLRIWDVYGTSDLNVS